MDSAWFAMQKIAWTIHLVFVNKVAVQNAEHLGGFLVQVCRYECARFHSDTYHRRTKRVVPIQGLYLDVSGVTWKRQVHWSDVRGFHNFINHCCSPCAKAVGLSWRSRIEHLACQTNSAYTIAS